MDYRTPRSFAHADGAVQPRTSERFRMTAADRDGREHLVGGITGSIPAPRHYGARVELAILLAIAEALMAYAAYQAPKLEPRSRVCAEIADCEDDAIRGDR